MSMNPEEIKRLTQGLGLAALAVGSLMVGKRYFENYQLRLSLIHI